MKRTLVFLLMSVFMGANSEIRAQKPADRIVVAYFSATGTTARAAREVARITGGALHAIEPAEPYTAADLDWHDRRSRSSVEMTSPQARPAIRPGADELPACDVLFIGYPIWWDQAPRIIQTFLESRNWRSTRLIPFATSGGSGVANSVAELRRAYPGWNWDKGLLLNRIDEKAILERLGR